MTEMLIEVTESYNGYLQKVPNGCQKIADNLRENQISESLQQIIDFTEGASWLLNASELLQKNGLIIDLKSEKIHEFLQEINNGLEIQDYVLIADMFEYEIKPFFEECQAVELQ